MDRCVAALAIFGFAALSPAQEPHSGLVARKALDLMLAEKYSQLRALFDQRTRDSIPEETLRVSLGPPLRGLGKPESIAEPIVTAGSPDDTVVIHVQYAQGILNAVFRVNRAGKIADFKLRPDASPTPTGWTSPPYSQPDRFRIRQTMVGQGTGSLPGTILIPLGRGPFPAIVLVHGSGPLDRDETTGINKPFRDIAEGLASRGIIVLRYEKRTKTYPALKNLTLEQETIDDALKAIVLVRQLRQVDAKRIFVLGHGLGGYAGPRIVKTDGKIAGLVILAGNARKPGGPVVEQYNPTLAARSLPCRLLILQGERDFEVPPNDFAVWKSTLAGKSNVTFHSYLALNHLFIAGEGRGSAEEYQELGHVSQNVIVDIAFWITS